MQGDSMHGNSRSRAMRVHLDALESTGAVMMHDGKQLVKGAPIDISHTGLFVETDDLAFEIGGRVQVTVKIPGVLHPFSQECIVARVNADARFPIGFGLQFTEVPEEVENYFGEDVASHWGECFLLTEEQRQQRILLVDADESFTRPFKDYVREKGLNIESVPHLGVFADLSDIDRYDKLVVSYDLEPFSGLQIAEILMKYLPHKPIVLLTMSRQPWDFACADTPNVVGVSNKWDGYRAVLTRALKK